jgi:hypothetical protein
MKLPSTMISLSVLYFFGFTASHGGVEQVFRPAVKLINLPASAAEVHRARICHNLKKYNLP